MIRSTLFAAASVLVLSACQPASQSDEESLVAETPPMVEEVDDASVSDGAVPVVENVAEEAHDHDAEHDHDEDGHDEDGHEEDHEDHDHDEDHDAHEHEDDDHDHDEDHDHAGGEAHVHGVSDLAVSLDGAGVSVSLDGALANFGLDETIRSLDETAPYTDGVIELVGGDCTRDQASASIRPIGDHGNLTIDLAFTCASIDALEAINVTGFANFSSFETVNAIVLTETGQSAKTLTASETRLDLR
ncbi:MAG: DUF2796 domain-containing protein [Pseudomonadota bacterium]